MIERSQNAGNAKRKKFWVAGSIILNLGILFVFKYSDFFLHNLSAVISRLGFGTIDKRLDLLLPVGISFYTFQALSYTLDVYRGEIKAEKNIFKYALFVSFFPQLVAGPIEGASNLMPQLKTERHFSVVCKCAVPIFFMVSGRLLMEREESLRIILKKEYFGLQLFLFSFLWRCIVQAI